MRLAHSAIVRQFCSISLVFITQLVTFRIASSLFSLPEFKIENRSVGGSIPPLGTNKFKHLDERNNLLDTWCRMLAMSAPVSKFESCIELIEIQLLVFSSRIWKLRNSAVARESRMSVIGGKADISLTSCHVR